MWNTSRLQTRGKLLISYMDDGKRLACSVANGLGNVLIGQRTGARERVSPAIGALSKKIPTASGLPRSIDASRVVANSQTH